MKSLRRISPILLKSLLLCGLAVYLTWTLLSGKLIYYINNRFFPLTILSVVLLVLMAAAGLRRRSETGPVSAAALGLIALPLILGVVVPASPLSAESVGSRGMGLSAPARQGQGADQALAVVPDERTILDWVKVFNYSPDPAQFAGQQASVIGFVYHDVRLGQAQFMVSRFSVSCCVADAFALGMAVNWPDSAALKQNTWVLVKGSVDQMVIDGRTVPLIHAEQVSPVPAPKNPYLYP